MRMRYYCDHCKKAGGSGKWMLHHEEACTLNPDRVCRVCPLLMDEDHAPLPELIETLENEGFVSLRKKAGECPACILAAIRQETPDSPHSKWYYPDPRDIGYAEFNFKDEMKEIFDDLNANSAHEGGY